MKRAIWVSAAAVLALAGCSKKADTGAATTASATAPAPVAATAPAGPPSRKAGLWEQKISTGSMQQTMKLCLDSAADQKMKWWGSQGHGGDSSCEQQTVTPHPGGGWDFHAVCAMGQSGTVTSDGSATGDFGSHYKVAVTSVTTGSSMPQANGTFKTSIEGAWLGPCPAGMKPGDMELPGGMRINAMDAAAGRPPAMAGGGGRPSQADIARMRAQAMEMAKAAKEQQ